MNFCRLSENFLVQNFNGGDDHLLHHRIDFAQQIFYHYRVCVYTHSAVLSFLCVRSRQPSGALAIVLKLSLDFLPPPHQCVSMQKGKGDRRGGGGSGGNGPATNGAGTELEKSRTKGSRHGGREGEEKNQWQQQQQQQQCFNSFLSLSGLGVRFYI
jgi:hypothetical protein